MVAHLTTETLLGWDYALQFYLLIHYCIRDEKIEFNSNKIALSLQ